MYSKSRNANKAPAAQKISPVTLALQLASGERLIAEFHPEGCTMKFKAFIINSLKTHFLPYIKHQLHYGTFCSTGKMTANSSHL
jgi:hypothetical protein